MTQPRALPADSRLLQLSEVLDRRLARYFAGLEPTPEEERRVILLVAAEILPPADPVTEEDAALARAARRMALLF